MDLFEAMMARDAAIAQADGTVEDSDFETAVVQRVTDDLLANLKASGRVQFTADLVGSILDGLNIVTDLHTRRRLVSTVINRGKGKTWRRIGSAQSTRRHCAEIALWALNDGTDGMSGDLIAMARSGITLLPGEARKVAQAYDKLLERCIRAERILDKLREPSEAVWEAAVEAFEASSGSTFASLCAAVEAAEQEVDV